VKSLAKNLGAYEAYHRDWRNKLTHFVGVPLVTFAVFLFLGWLRFAHAPDVPFTGATLFFVVVFLYYLCLDWQVALVLAPFSIALLWLADVVALWPFPESLAVFAATFLGGWAVQLLGHGFEGRRPALADNLLQIFNAPLFLTTEVLLYLGYRQDLSEALPATRVVEVFSSAAAPSVGDTNEPLQPPAPALVGSERDQPTRFSSPH
jgi:uncharacterized membrane protein YGL010W